VRLLLNQFQTLEVIIELNSLPAEALLLVDLLLLVHNLLDEVLLDLLIAVVDEKLFKPKGRRKITIKQQK
tara:strand:+ start:645 stop:854 length:210 start_codon:yes stop_codon:yes gene_type:complete